MTEQNVNPAFADALKRRQEQKAEQEQAATQNWSNFNYEEIETVGLIINKEIVGRIIGNPIEVRQLPTDPKLILQSQVVKQDKSGYVKINWPVIEKSGKYIPDPDWILTEMFNKVNEGRWVKYSEGVLKDENGQIYPADHVDSKGKNGKWVKYHTNTNVFKAIDGNAKDGEKYPKNFYPSKRVVCNWIDRHDSWCADNKHSKVLTAKKTPFEISMEDGSKKTIYFQDTGIPAGLYDKIFEHCSSIGTMDIDLVITKIEKDYKVFDITDFPKYVSESSHKLGKQGKLSEEELAYELYDLDKLYGVSSYRKIKKNLGYLFKMCDLDLGTEFEKKLDNLCKIEEEEAKEKQVQDEPDEGESSSDSKEDSSANDSTSKDEVKQEQVESKRRGVKKEESSVDNSIKEECIKYFPTWNKLSDADQEFMVNSIVRFDNGVPVYNVQNALGCANEDCYIPGTRVVTLVPEEVSTCPVCGKIFTE